MKHRSNTDGKVKPEHRICIYLCLIRVPSVAQKFACRSQKLMVSNTDGTDKITKGYVPRLSSPCHPCYPWLNVSWDQRGALVARAVCNSYDFFHWQVLSLRDGSGGARQALHESLTKKANFFHLGVHAMENALPSDFSTFPLRESLAAHAFVGNL